MVCSVFELISQTEFLARTFENRECFSVLVPTHGGALRLAHDPVPAADFFEFSIRRICLAGSGEQGGMLGHIKASYS
ncbi:hypothetical protein P692DRAFT_20174640 [Suillus brevipes Sb2]|nr:hypothetical protein P692DRAFT_20174640 [Suillus brevipes Sb2]